eukprot:EG_transcript_65902
MSAFRCTRLLRNGDPMPGILQFVDRKVLRGKKPIEAGRGWSDAELRKVSNEDLIKLYQLSWKERNMLWTMQAWYRSREMNMPHAGRITEVQRTIHAIRYVL